MVNIDLKTCRPSNRFFQTRSARRTRSKEVIDSGFSCLKLSLRYLLVTYCSYSNYIKVLKKTSLIIVLPVSYLLCCVLDVSYAGPPAVGGTFPQVEFAIPSNPEHVRYLNLAEDSGVFILSQIGAQVVIVEIFSMYCPHCQREAPTLNNMFRRIEASPGLAGKVKLIGIGAGNSAFEVDFFRKEYDIPFPLFPDGDFQLHKLLGEVRTPYFFGLAIQPEAQPRVFFSQLGGARDAGKLLDDLIRAAGLE